MNEFPRMMYQAGGPEAIHGGHFSTLVVHDATELDAALAGGWHLTTPEALAANAPKPDLDALAFNVDDDAPPTRAELEAKARELGVEFTARLGDAKLAERIAAALAAKA